MVSQAGWSARQVGQPGRLVSGWAGTGSADPVDDGEDAVEPVGDGHQHLVAELVHGGVEGVGSRVHIGLAGLGRGTELGEAPLQEGRCGLADAVDKLAESCRI